MTYDQLVKAIENIELDEEIMFDTSTFAFGLTRMEIQDEDVLIFGGYGTHQSIWQLRTSDEYEIADEIIKHINGYHSEIEGKKWLTIDEMEIRK